MNRHSIFLSYRRADSEDVTGRIRDRLQARFGTDAVFIDTSDIPGGSDFRSEIAKKLYECEAAIIVVGPDWFAGGQPSPRLSDPQDTVRREVEAILTRHIPVFPVLVHGMSVSSLTLPSELSRLLDHNFLAVRGGSDFDGDVDKLIREIRRTLATRPKYSRRTFLAACSATLAAGGGTGFATAWLFSPRTSGGGGSLTTYLRSVEIQAQLGDLIRRATSEVWFVGVNMFMSVKANRDLLVEKLAAGVALKYLLLDPSSSKIPQIAADQDVDEKTVRGENHTTLEGLADLLRVWKSVSATARRQGTLEIRFHDSGTHGRLYLFDPSSPGGCALVVPYMMIASSPELPAYLLKSGALSEAPYYTGVLKLWSSSTPLDELKAKSQEVGSIFR